jgi:hypothetical protein
VTATDRDHLGTLRAIIGIRTQPLPQHERPESDEESRSTTSRLTSMPNRYLQDLPHTTAPFKIRREYKAAMALTRCLLPM